MGRARKKADQWMPPRVYRGKSAYEFRPKPGGCIRLCGLDQTQSTVWKRYEEESQAQDNKFNVAGLIREFLESADFLALSPRTQKDYQKYSKNIIKVFGKMAPKKVKPVQVRAYMDRRGVASRTQANREHSFFSRVMSWAYERGKVENNPCKGVRKFTEKARDRYIMDEEYQSVYDCASNAVKVAMEISYLCAARKGDVLNLKWSQIGEDGIYIKQGKTGKKQIKAWSPRLRQAIALAKTLGQDNVSSCWVVSQATGKQFTERTFQLHWQTAKDNAKELTQMALDFTFHDLKAKSISDFEGTLKDKQNFSGHKTESQVASYDRKVRVVPTIGSK